MGKGSGPTVAFILDNPQRDLGGLVLTAMQLCEQGVTCHLVPATLRAREIFALAPDLVVMFHFRRGFEALVTRLMEARIRVGVLDTEGGVWPDLQIYTELQIAERPLRDAVRFFCSWGPRLGDHLVSSGLFQADQVVVTGCPRFDFYHERWRASVPTPGVAADGRPRILVNANYSEANPRFWPVEVVARQLRESWGWTEERVSLVLDRQRAMLQETLTLVRRLADDVPDATIVLRPHPFESVDVYRRELGALPGVSVEDAGTAQQQIVRAHATIQRTSTTAMESVLAGVPALMPAWFPVAAPMPMVDAVSEPCEQYPVLLDRVREVLAGSYTPDAALTGRIHSVVGDWFSTIDGAAHSRVADTVLAHLPAHREVDVRACQRVLHGLSDGHPWRSRVPRLVRRQLALPPEYSFRRLRAEPPKAWLASEQRFTVIDVSAMADQVSHARRSAGLATVSVQAVPTHQRPEFPHRFHAYSVALASAS